MSEKMEFIDIRFKIFREELVYHELLKIKDLKNPEINTSEKIFKLTRQVLSK